MKNRILITLTLALTACTNMPAPSEQKEPVEVVTGKGRDAVLAVLSKHPACTGYVWKDRSKAPMAYMRGMALAFYRAKCSGNNVAAVPASTRDALQLYGLKAGNVQVYTLMLGLGMRESSGKHCTGIDTTNAKSTTAETCEAGAFQVSYNSRNVLKSDGSCCIYNQKDLMDIYAKWKNKSAKECDLDVWADGVTCSTQNWKYYGTGEGVEFQRLMKTCPAFAAEYTAAALRLERHHWGPIKDKEAEYRAQCEAMFADIEKVECQ